MGMFDDLIPTQNSAPLPPAMSFQDLVPPKMGLAEDVGRSVISGLDRGVATIAGLPADAALGIQWLVNHGQALTSGKNFDQVEAENDRKAVIPRSAVREYGGDAIHAGSGLAHNSETTAGRYAQTAAEFIPSAALGPGSAARNVLAYGVAPGLASEAAGEAVAGTKLEPIARVAAALAGGMAGGRAGRLITPNPASPERQRLVEILRDEGVDSLTAGQRTGSKTLQYAESTLGDAPGAGGGASRMQEQGQRQFTEAAMRRAGAGPDASPEVMRSNNQRLGRQFEDLASRNSLRADPQIAVDLGQTLCEYDRVLPAAQKEIVGNLATDIVDRFTAGNGVMAGIDYQAARSRLSRMANNSRVNDPDFADALRGLRNALDSGMQRSISPADREAWQATRREYGAQKTLEKAASRAGEASAEGQIVPSNLRNAVATGNNRGAYARGEGDFSELARAGSGVMAKLPQSGTGPRVAINTIAGLLGSGAGAVAGGGGGAAAGALAGAVAGPAVAGRILMSRPVQAYLSNQLVGRNPTSRAAEISQLLLAGRNALIPNRQQQHR